VVLGVWVSTRGRAIPKGRALGVCVLLGTLFAAVALCYFEALRHASSGVVALMMYTYPMWVALISAALGLERFGKAERCALPVCACGLVMLLGQDIHGGSFGGIGLALLAGALYAVYILTGSRFAGDTDPIASTWVVTSTSAVITLALALGQGGVSVPHSAEAWGAVFALAGFSSVMAVAAFLMGLRRIGPTLTAVVSTLEPVITVGLGLLFLGESLSAGSAAGSVLVLGAALGLAFARSRAPRLTVG